MDIRRILYVFHCVQEIVSAEKTPTLCVVLPLYERLITMLTELGKVMPHLAFAIEAGVVKLREYLNYSDNTKMYTLALGQYFKFLHLYSRITESFPLFSSQSNYKIAVG